MTVIAYQLDLHQPMQSVPTFTTICEVYSPNTYIPIVQYP